MITIVSQIANCKDTSIGLPCYYEEKITQERTLTSAFKLQLKILIFYSLVSVSLTSIKTAFQSKRSFVFKKRNNWDSILHYWRDCYSIFKNPYSISLFHANIMKQSWARLSSSSKFGLAYQRILSSFLLWIFFPSLIY